MPKSKSQKPRHNPLHAEDNNSIKEQDELFVPDYVDPKTSRKILAIVKQQQQDIQDEFDGPIISDSSIIHSSNKFENIIDSDENLSEDDFDVDFEYDVDLDQQDIQLMNKFMTTEPRQMQSLSTSIMSRINSLNNPHPDESKPSLNEKVVEVYTKVGLLLSRYRSGPLPKTFKIIPSLPNWLQILMLTSPQNWTPHATYQATRLFTSNLKAHMVTKFFTEILLEKVRDDIAENKNLSFHLYMALKKALYKPSAFFKGILVPICQNGNCTLREAVIIGSVITKIRYFCLIKYSNASFCCFYIKACRNGIYRCQLSLYSCFIGQEICSSF